MSPSGVGPTPNRLGRYHLAEPIGGGPTGEVFRAKVYGVAGFERQFAVKRFHPQFVKDPTTAEAVAAAARVYGGLEHPRIARLHEYGVTGGHAFTATELVDGIDLARLLSLLAGRGERLPRGGAAAVVAQLARTLGYAHGRGICHLGLCPTNIILTTDGDAKITDFGFLVARLPKKPEQDPSLRSRMPYLAPEQVSSELTSAATDVFQLGIIAYEMFHGRRAFSGADSRAIAQAILSGKRPPMELPKPMATVIARCLSRSPFERYPDARALADGMDAATRELSLVGGLPDIGQLVRDALEQVNEIDEGEMSGALSFPLPAPPRGDAMMDHIQAPVEDLPPTMIRDPSSLSDDSLRVPPVSESPPPSNRSVDMPTIMPTPLGPSNRMGQRPLTLEPLEGPIEEMDEEMPTVIRERERGFVRPTPLGLASIESIDEATGRLGEETARPSAPSHPSPPRPPSLPPRLPTPEPRLATPPPLASGMGGIPELTEEPMELSGSALEVLEPFDEDDQEAPPAALEGPGSLSSPFSSDAPGMEREASAREPALASHDPASDAEPASPIPRSNLPQTMSDLGRGSRSSDTWDPLTPVPRSDPGASRGVSKEMAIQAIPPARSDAPGRTHQPEKKRRGVGFWLLSLVVLLGLAAGGYVLYNEFLASRDGGEDSPEREPTQAIAADAAAPDTVADAGPPTSPGDAGPDIPDAAVDAESDVALMPPEQVATDDGKLTIESTPKRAKIYLDGSDLGRTPHSMDATSDRHRIAIIQPGYKLYTVEIEGRGRLSVTLEEATPPDGPAGIKVRCAKKNRYYVFVDGADTGQLCPSERIGVTEGPHVVEIYDPVTETRREFPVSVEGTRHSLRLRVD